MGQELLLAVDSCITESSALVVAIIKKVVEITKFKKKCAKLGEEAQILLLLLANRKSAIQSLQTLEEFKGCINSINQFADTCKSYGVLNVSYEVLIRRKYSSLVRKVSALKEVFILESVTEILVREDRIVKAIEDSRKFTADDIKSAQQKLVGLEQKLKAAQEGSLSNSLSITADFMIAKGTNIRWHDDTKRTGYFELEHVGRLVCHQIEPSFSLKNSLDIYRDIQYGAYVQRYFGIARVGNEFYVVMEGLNEDETLAEACLEHALPPEIPKRVNVAYNIAKTMAWCHKANLLLKSLSDRHVAMHKDSTGNVIPYLVRMESVRHILERTAGITYDTRYEAPEYQLMREHTRQTDIWSLGVVVWQCLSGRMPFDVSEPTDGGDTTAQIRTRLANGEVPGSLDGSTEDDELWTVIESCWNKDPLLRPTATFVAESLLNCLMRFSISEDERSSGIRTQEQDTKEPDNSALTELQSISMQAIMEARRLNEKSTIFKQSELRLKEHEFESLVDEEKSADPVHSFIIGAIVFWNLGGPDLGDNDEAFLGICHDEEEDRALEALPYLETAARSGYEMAFIELYKAHATLARKYISRSKRMSS